ncbi:hypothetical protein [Janthinobacterium sp. SUN206]|uniref:hypothetical protein n=1 Tax=Janthinobacterium sp. SUN206 TaxID=3014787 RepID=UPI00271311B8|nr:hypothetical protein [Janthinobacterium sp. SUN206]MDO8065581.1 hypothetical protein [Janthinobacterium sp. SUN206]
MNTADTPRFMQLLAETLAAYGKPLPEPAMARAWLANLEPFPLPTVAAALQAYRDENGEFAPVPAGIAKRCKLMDGRPGAEEAWAIALTSQDEMASVVWTTEIAEAFRICRPVLDSSGAISARKPFLEAYERIVATARAARHPAEWVASVGWDKTRHVEVLGNAVRAGLLPAPAVAGLLQGKQDQTTDDAARAQLAAIKKMIADGAAAKEVARLEGVEQQRLADEEFKRSTAERVQLYMAGGRNAAGPASANAAHDLPEAPPHCARVMAATK